MVSDFAQERLRPLAPGILLALASIAFGFGLGIAFGAAEDDLKDHLRANAQAVLESGYAGDEAATPRVLGAGPDVGDRRSWLCSIISPRAGVGVQGAHGRELPDVVSWRRTVGAMFAASLAARARRTARPVPNGEPR